jgi:hypothetical protein
VALPTKKREECNVKSVCGRTDHETCGGRSDQSFISLAEFGINNAIF